MRKPRVLVVHDDPPVAPLSSFIAHDIAHLQKRYEVEVISLHPYRRDHLEALLSAKVWRAVAGCDAVFAWFGVNAPALLMAAALRKPSVVIAGGSDVVHVPEINYGLDPARKVKYRMVLAGYRVASRILLFSGASHRDLLELAPHTKSKAETLYLGVDTQAFRPGASPPQPRVLCVSFMTEKSIRRKGVLTLIEAARLTPEVPYRIAGRIIDEGAVKRIVESAPPNVTFLGSLSDEELLREMQSAKVYAQLSYHEGFGMAVAEAMACGSIAVVSDRGSLPEVVGDTGYYVPVEDPKAAARAFREAIAAGEVRGQRARQRVIDQFDPAARERALHRIRARPAPHPRRAARVTARRAGSEPPSGA
jgi:glycosyltransferase involved in cell wall biosynthesis